MELLSSASGHLTGPDFQVSIRAGNHAFLSDEPVDFHGADTGPDPYSLLLSSLCSCTVITVKMYANRKEWLLENVEVTCELIRNEPGKLPEIYRRIRISGDLSEDQRQRLLQIANACPVHKLLSNTNFIISSLSD
jgi:putative redox protein